MKGKVMTSVLGATIAMSVFAGTSFADENKDVSKSIDLIQSESKNVVSFTAESEAVKEADKMLEEVKSFGMVPVELEEVLNLKDITGVNPIYFPSTDLSKVVQHWKVVGEQYLRENPELDSEIVRVLKEGQEVEVLEKASESWYKVKITDEIIVKHEGKERQEIKEQVGFISSEYIQLVEEEKKEELIKQNSAEIASVKKELLTDIKEEIKKEEEQRRLEAERKAKEEAERKAREEAERKAQLEAQRQAAEKQKAVASAPSSYSSSVLENAKKYIGAGYLYGASPSRTDVFDCSSFTQRVFKEAGISLPRNSRAQAGVGTTVSRSNLQAGDLIFFNTSGSGISHVGIYVGGGKFVGAQSSGVGYADMNSSYWSGKYITAKRVR